MSVASGLRAEGEADFSAGRFDSAIQAWRSAAQIDAPPPQDAFWARLALAMRRAGRLDDLKALVRDLDADGMTHVHAHLQLALLLNERQGVDAGLAALNAAAARREAGDLLDLLRIEVHLLSAAARFEDAVDAVRRMRLLEAPNALPVMRTSLAIIERKMRTASLREARAARN
ncbi:MAG: hypothetical protein HC850_18200 [Rhodomicrobium sp.]|nr:hypothetical protein [Rhodomicrobium sp.]